MCSLSAMATEVSFYNKNNIQVSQIEDGQPVKVETGNIMLPYIQKQADN